MKLKLSEKRRTLLSAYGSILLVAAVLAIIPLFMKTQYKVQTLTMMLLWAYMATSWNIVGGSIGLFGLGNGVYMALGGYLTVTLHRYFNISPWIGMLIAAVVVATISCIITFPCFRLKGTYYSLSTVAVLMIGKTLITNNREMFGLVIGGAAGLKMPYRGGFANMQFVKKEPYFYIMLAFFVILLLVTTKIRYSKMGYYFSAIKANQDAAETLGVNTSKYKLYAQFIAVAFTAIGGAFYGELVLFLDPARILSYGFSLEIVLYAIVGGLGTLWGPAVGAFILYPVSEFLRVQFGDAGSLSKAFYAVIFMVVVFFMPQGIFPALKKLITELFYKLKQKKEAKGCQK